MLAPDILNVDELDSFTFGLIGRCFFYLLLDGSASDFLNVDGSGSSYSL